MPGMSRGGGGGGQTGGGGGGYASDMLGGMFNQAGGFGGGGFGGRSKYSFGNPPPERSPSMYETQRRCAAGDGRACNEAKIQEQQYQAMVAAYRARENQAQQKYSDTHKKSPSMGAYRGR